MILHAYRVVSRTLHAYMSIWVSSIWLYESMWRCIHYYVYSYDDCYFGGVNSQLPPWNCKFRQLPPLKLTKLQLPSWNCTTLINLTPLSNFSVSQHDVLQIPPWSFALMCKMPHELENLYFFSYP